MTDLSISAGGVVQVDTDTLRDAALRLRRIGEACEDAGETVRASARGVAAIDPQPATDLLVAASSLATAAENAHRLSWSLQESAALYETVELLVHRSAALAAGDAVGLARLDARLSAVGAERPATLLTAYELMQEHPSHDELRAQAERGALTFGPLAPAFVWAAGVVAGGTLHALGVGTIPAGSRLSGRPDPVVLDASPPSAVRPPTTLAAAAARIPGSGDARVRVERYAMPDGSAQFAVYVAGTRAVGGREAFDMRSNLQLYAGVRSASYQAVVSSLEAAGARPGDAVHTFGHSQGAMVLERLALEGPYETRTLVSFGSPVQAEVGDATLAVSVRHTDDPVAALQDGGSPAPVGAAGSFVAERVADPAAGAHDLLVPAHQLSAYAHTAALIDASTDPRVDGLRDVFENLAAASGGQAVEYAVARVSPGTWAAGSARGHR